MKILCISDIHGYLDGLIYTRNYLIKKHVHAVFILGDYSVGFKDARQNELDARYALEVLRNNAKVWGLPGNCDQPHVVEVLEEEKENMHERVLELEGISFLGLGGSNPTPFGTPFEYSEKEIRGKLTALYDKAQSDRVMLITHFPPNGTACDVVQTGAHVGSTSLRKIIEERQPLACVCSHIHESAGKTDSIGETRVVNVGMLSHDNAVVIDTEDASVTHVEIR